MAEDQPLTDELEPKEARQAEAQAPLRPKVIHEIIREEGQAEIDRTAGALLWSGLAAGLSMGFSFLVQAQLRAGLPDTAWRHLVESLGYTVGFVIVVLGRQQLFTENTLTAVLPALSNRDRPTLLKMLRLWGLVLLANTVGTWLFAAALLPDGLLRPEVQAALTEIAREAVQGPFLPTLMKGVFAGWLIALMVWLQPNARSARLLVILLITYVVSLGRLSHIIAGSSEAAYAVLRGTAGLGSYALAFYLPTLIGNIIGGVALVAMLNHAPIASEAGDPGP